MCQAVNVIAKRIVFPQAYSLEFETSDLSSSAIPDDSIMIRTEYSLISPGTELAFYTGTHIDINNPANKWAKLPFYPGYASVGEIVAVGRSVTQVESGMRVMALGHHSSYDIVPYSEEFVIPVPEHVESRSALFARLAEISSTALVLSKYQPGDTALVIGLGMIGNLAAQLFALQGVYAIGMDVDERRLQTARATNVPDVIHSGECEDLTAKFREMTGREAPDLVIEATGNPALVNTALELVRPRGQVILLGSPRGTAEIDVYRHIHRKGVSLIGAHANLKGVDGLATSAEMLRYSMGLIANRQLSVAPLISHLLPAEQALHGYEMLLHHKEGALGVILDWTKS